MKPQLWQIIKLATIAGISCYTASLMNSRRKPRRWWVRPINANRSLQGDGEHLLQELFEDPEMFFNYTRMNQEDFMYLFNLIKTKLEKHSNRKPIPAIQRLALTLRFLATGDNMQSCAFAYRIGKATACNIIRETCDAIWYGLQEEYVRHPTKDDWKQSAMEFTLLWQLPNCMGALDGKHIVIKCPPNSGSLFFNYKKTYSIVLLGLCDAKYRFLYVDVGAYGSQSDGGIFRRSSLGQNLLYNTLDVPEDAPLPEMQEDVPYFFVADEAFPLRIDLLRPYGGRHLTHEKKIFNYRLSRARRCIENAFGILAARFQIYHRTISALPKTADSIVKATVALHNYILMREEKRTIADRRYCYPQYVDTELPNGNIIPGEWRNEHSSVLQPLNTLKWRMGTRNSTQQAIAYRDYLSNYVNNILPLAWQNAVINRVR